MDELYKNCDADENCGMYHLHGYLSAGFQERRFLAIASVASYPTESVLGSLIDDDRVLRNAVELEELAADELLYIESLPMFCWRHLAELVGEPSYSGMDLRQDTLQAAHTSVAYVYNDLFRQVHQEPLSFTQGDIAAHVAALAVRITPITDPVTLQLRGLLDYGVPNSRLVRALELLRDAPCSTNITEQAHKVGALLMRDHKSYGELTLRARATIGQAEPLFNKSEFQKSLQRLEQSLKKVGARKPSICGFRAFCGMVPDGELRALMQDFHMEPDEHSQISLSTKRDVYGKLPLTVQATFEQESAKLRTEKLGRTFADKNDLLDQIAALKKGRQEDIDNIGVVNHVSETRFSDSDVNGITERFNLIDGALARRLEAVVLDAPGVPTVDEQELLDSFSEEEARRHLPWWCRQVCYNRDRWEMAAVSNEEDPARAFLILLALQSPNTVVFLELRRLDNILDPSAELLPGRAINYGQMVFDIYPLKHYTEDDVPIDSDGDIYVLPFCRFGKRQVIGTPSERFEHFVSRHPVVGAARAPAVKRRRPVIAEERDKLMAEFPFLRPEDFGEAHGQLKRKRVGIEARRAGFGAEEEEDAVLEPSEVEDPEGLPEGEVSDDGGGAGEDYDERELAALRYDWKEEDQDELSFYTHIIGGPSIHRLHGHAAVAAAAFARGGVPSLWCATYRWQIRTAFHYGHYSVEGSHELAREVCRRGHFFYTQWLGQDSDTFDYQRHHLDAYEESESWLNWVLDQPLDSACFNRATEVRKIVPLNPTWG